jgi:sugar lactone lactonase YvrE
MSQRYAVKLLTLLMTSLLVLSMVSVAGASSPAVPEHTLPEGGMFPEGVAVLQGSKYFFISSFASGTIYRGQLDQVELEEFLPGGEDGRTVAVGMDIDPKRNRLYIAGAWIGKIWAYDLTTKELITTASVDGDTFINDLTVARDGTVYATDSDTSVIYRLEADAAGEVPLEPWAGPIDPGPLFNLNGIVVTPDGKYLLAVHSRLGTLYRITINDGTVVPVDLGDTSLTTGDGLVMRGQKLSVVRNMVNGDVGGEIVILKMTHKYTSGEFVASLTDPSFHYPTTAAIHGGRLLVVNAQFDQLFGGSPDLPFTVSSLPVSRLNSAHARGQRPMN